MINLLQFYDDKGVRYVLNGSSIPDTAADYADRRTYDFLTGFCVERKLLEHVKTPTPSGEWMVELKVLDEATMIAEAKSRGIGVAYDEEDMKRRDAL